MADFVEHAIEIVCVSLAVFFMGHGIFHRVSANGHRKDKSFLGTINSFPLFSKKGYSVEGWRHLHKGRWDAMYFALVMLAFIVLKGIVHAIRRY
jgi:hypothetical protein